MDEDGGEWRRIEGGRRMEDGGGQRRTEDDGVIAKLLKLRKC